MLEDEQESWRLLLSIAEREGEFEMRQLQPVEPGMQVRRDDIVAQCEGAYLCKSRVQYSLVIEGYNTRHWSRRKVNFEMALKKANKVLEELLS